MSPRIIALFKIVDVTHIMNRQNVSTSQEIYF